MQMHKIPDEILLRIFTMLVNDVESLIKVGQVNKRFHSLIDDPKLWYNAFLSRYPVWGSRVEYSFNSKKLIDWKDFMIHLVKQQKATENFSFEFVQEQLHKSRKRRFVEDTIDEEQQEQEQEPPLETPFWIQDPLVVDIDRIDKTGIVATGKHRKHALSRTSQHKILFWEYPSWKLIRTFELNLAPSNITCQIIGIQSIRMPTANGKGFQKVRFFTLAVGIAFLNGLDQQQQQQQQNNDEFEDRVDIWKAIFVYRLFDDGSTQCVAHVKVEDLFLGREVFLFSDTSWCQSNDGDCNESSMPSSNLTDWMDIVCPTRSPSESDNSRFTVYMLAIGPIFERNITGCVQLAKFDLRGQRNILDPSITPVIWDGISNQLVPIPKKYQYFLGLGNTSNNDRFLFGNATEMITCIRLGTDVSCMIHFKYPPYLNHLICTGSYQDDELSVYDWRFGIKVGSLPWKTTQDATVIRRTTNTTSIIHPEPQDLINIRLDEEILPQLDLNMQRNELPRGQEQDVEEDDDADTVEVPVDVRPWGLESTLVLPPYWMSSDGKESVEYSRDDLAQHGFRLIAVGDNRSDNQRDKLEIKVWDISYLLQVKWDPLIDNNTQDEETISDSLLMELTQRFSWWPRRTKELSRLAIQMILEQQYQSQLLSQHEFSIDLTNNNHNLQNNTNDIQPQQQYTNKKLQPQQFILPYSPPKGLQSMLLSHTFDKDEQQPQDIPVKYTAYNVLYTSLFLLTEDGKVTVMDIETGKITGTVENVAQVEGKRSSHTQQVRGIDVNVIGGREVVVTSKEGLLRGIVS